MYEFEKAAARDGDAFLGVQGTFRIGDTVYALSAEADDRLLVAMTSVHYAVARADKDGYTARRLYELSKHEMLDDVIGGMSVLPYSVIVDLRYAGGRRHNLSEQNIHETIVRAAGQSPHLDWYNRSEERFAPDVIARMGAFASNLVEGVSRNDWTDFSANARFLHAADFIKSLAAWSSRRSDREDRLLRRDVHAVNIVTVRADDTFQPPRKDFGGLMPY